MKKIKIEIKSRWTGKVLFEYSCENNTVKKTLKKAVSQGAYLRGAYLKGADLGGVDLRDAYLGGADLRDAYLGGADLGGAYLRDAYLRDAYLGGADLGGVDLIGADLIGVKLPNEDQDKIKHLFQIIPEEGSFIGWKKLSQEMIAKLEIPAKAKRTCNIKNRKCRASYVKTLQIIDKNGNEVKEGIGSHDNKTVYKVGRLTRSDKYDDNFLQDCTHGIHFFISKQEALNY